MAVEQSGAERSVAARDLIDVLDRVLDKGIVIDASVRVSLAGIDVVNVETRVVLASVETYLRTSDAVAASCFASRPLPAPVFSRRPVPSAEMDRVIAENTELRRKLNNRRAH